MQGGPGDIVLAGAGEASLTLASQPASIISVAVSGLPALGNRLILVADGAALQRLVRVVKNYTPGQTATTMTIEVPAGGAYRIRVAAFTAGDIYPAILRTGKATGLQAPANAAVVLADPAFTLLAATPTTAPAGSTISLEATLVDSGDVVAGMPVASVRSREVAFTKNLDGTEWRGVLEGLGSGSYRFSVPVTLPASAATTYYQFTANAYDFNDPSGNESPHFCWPNLQGGQALKQIASAVSSSIRITFSGTPAAATRIIAVVDQGGLSEPARAAASFTAGTPPSSMTVGVPVGGPYRVRLIALRSGLSTPVILRSGKATGVNVPAGATESVAVALADYTVALDAATPTTGTAGSTVTIVANVADPGETASGANTSRLYGAPAAFTQNLSVAPVLGILEKNANGTMKLTAPGALPGSGGMLYYQVAYEALDFGDVNGVERPHFCWPNLEAAQALRQIVSNANPSLYTISGKVTLSGAALSGVAMTLTGLRTATTATASDGSYSFAVLQPGGYTVTPARTNFTFSPVSTTLVLAANQTVNFSASQISGSIGITVSGLPPQGNRLVAVVDGPALQRPLRAVQDYSSGQSSTVISIDAPAVGGYRVRVVAFAAGGSSPAILRAGKGSGVQSPGSVLVALADPSVTPLEANPASAPAGSAVSLAATLVDPGDAVAGVPVASVYSRTQPFAANLDGAETRGLLETAGSGSYRISALLNLPPSAAITYYQFAANAFDFNDPNGSESPHYCWPNPQGGQSLRQVASTLSSSIQITVAGTPVAATRLVAVVDQGGLSQRIRAVADFAAGQTPAGMNVDVPPGGPYRVRLIALRSGPATPVILRSGVSSGVSVPLGATAAATITLADFTVALDPATPASGITGAAAAVLVNINDPGETASGVSASLLYGSVMPFSQNLPAAPVSGQVERPAAGALRLSALVTLPAAGSVLHYQVAYEAAEFGDVNGLERPFFCWPNVEAGQALQQIAANPKPVVYTISGRATLDGAALSGVTVTLSGARTGTVLTASDGAYSFADLQPGVYTVTAQRTNFTFATPSATLTLASNRTVNFTVSQIKGTVGVSRTALRFGATAGGTAATAAQEIAVDISDNLPVKWTISSDRVWLKATPAAAAGSGRFQVSLDPAALPGAGIWLGKLTLTTSTSSSAQIVIQAQLAVSPSTGAPFGVFDTPANNATGLSASVPVTGWALDDVGVKKVQIWRDPIPREPVHPNGLVYIGDAVFVPDTRPDIAALFPDKPNSYRSGWGYMMLTNFLAAPPGGRMGNGTYRLHAIAVDEEGKQTVLGVKTITVDNLNATKPFGTVDTPAQGETVSGASFNVSGWALTPQPHKVVESGKDIWIVIDGVFLGNIAYNGYRSDIASLFPTYANANAAAGAYTLDTTRLANGMHSIAWFVTDSAGRADGLGSRFFFVRNTTAVAAQAPEPLPVKAMAALDATAVDEVEVEELGRVELQLPPGLPWRGRLVHNEDRVPLPVGSTLDSEGGVFVWQLGVGYLGTYTLEFENANLLKSIRVLVRPPGSARDLAK